MTTIHVIEDFTKSLTESGRNSEAIITGLKLLEMMTDAMITGRPQDAGKIGQIISQNARAAEAALAVAVGIITKMEATHRDVLGTMSGMDEASLQRIKEAVAAHMGISPDEVR